MKRYEKYATERLFELLHSVRKDVRQRAEAEIKRRLLELEGIQKHVEWNCYECGGYDYAEILYQEEQEDSL
jgi:hypothetical protein